MIVARQQCCRGELPVMTRSIPALAERRHILRLDQLVLHTRREHPRLAPAPHFLPALIPHNEIVGLSAREPKLNHLRRVVAHIERKLDNLARVHRELRAQRNLRMLFSGRCCQGRLVPHVTARERNDGCCTQQGNDQSICHTTWRPAREIQCTSQTSQGSGWQLINI
jgi:hypothetical protein